MRMGPYSYFIIRYRSNDCALLSIIEEPGKRLNMLTVCVSSGTKSKGTVAFLPNLLPVDGAIRSGESGQSLHCVLGENIR